MVVHGCFHIINKIAPAFDWKQAKTILSWQSQSVVVVFTYNKTNQSLEGNAASLEKSAPNIKGLKTPSQSVIVL